MSQVPARNHVSKDLLAIQDLLRKNERSIADALPKHMTPARMLRVALTELRRVPRLQQCDPMSFMGSIVQAAQLGLEPGSALGHCYLIPYKNECTLQIGYRGMIDIARRSGNIVSFSARTVHANDKFELTLGTDERLHHVPASLDRGEMIAAYAVAKLKDGGTQFEVMSRKEIERIRDLYSMGYKRDKNSSPWHTEFDEMAKKTVVRRLFKMLPTSIEIRDAVRIDDAGEGQDNHRLIDADYELPIPAPDVERITATQAAGANDRAQTPEMKRVELDGAIADFQRSVKAAEATGIDVAKVLGRTPAQVVMTGDPGIIYVQADLLDTHSGAGLQS